ncbi:MAG: OmpA family protein [Acidobacteriota bacterium]
MHTRSPLAILTLCLGTASLFGQGLTTTATKDDWEEINFVFDSSILSDGYPSLLRLAELLQQQGDYKVALEGHTDSVGSVSYNDKLSQARAGTVRSFLVKYGAREGQISIVARGKGQPKVPNQTAEGRFINRRVTVTLRDGQGRVVSEGGIREAIKAMQEAALKQTTQCCEDVLKKLDKLDEILALLKDLKAENEKLKQEVALLQRAQPAAPAPPAAPPKPPEPAELARGIEAATQKAVEEAKPARFALLGLNFGPSLNESLVSGFGRGNLTFTGRGRYFAPFGKNEMHALQAEGEYLYYRDRQEGQFDLGLVNRYRNMQLGLFSSMKHVSLTELGGGTLGQAALTADYLFSRGRFGAFGTKGYLDNRVIGRRPISPSGNVILENYLKIVDQIGASTQLGAWKDAYFDASFGALFRRGGTNRPGGMLRLVQPINPQWAFTVEAGLNETLVGPKNTGRIAFGLQFGQWLRPKQFTEVKHPVPVEIPRLRYEVLTRTVRTGNAPPVADAGPDQIGVAAGAIAFDGSGSFDSDGDPLTFQWDQIGGPAVSLTGRTAARAGFTAAEGQTYHFRLTVKDTQGAQGTDSVTVTTAAPLQVRIVRFNASPSTIRVGGTSTLVWQIENADSAEITTLGRVDPRGGASTVAPTQTTSYRLTARNRFGEVSETVTVTVEQPQVRILFFQASPVNIIAGESSTLSWQTENAEQVTLSEAGAVALSGNTVVSPARTTTYTLTARNRLGEVTASATVQVTPGTVPRIIRFAAAPVEILTGEQSTLFWLVENATEVSIGGIGRVEMAGSRDVGPVTTTTYTLTARNTLGEATATATVVVSPRAAIRSFTARPTTVPRGGAVVLEWVSENATSAFISGVGAVQPSGSVTVNPTESTTYTLTVTGNRSQASAQVSVTVTAPVVTPPTPPPPTPTGPPPVADAGKSFETLSRTVRLDGTGSRDPSGGTLTYRWTVRQTTAAIVDPTSPTPLVQLGVMFGDYFFDLTVTNSQGLSSTATVVVKFAATRIY